MRQSGVVVHAATVKVPNFSMRSECRGNRAVRKCCTFLGAHLTISFQNRQRDHYLRSNGACNDFQPKKKTSLLFGFQTAQCSGVTPSNNRSDEDKKEDNCCSNALLEDTNQPQFLSSLQIKSLVPSLTTRILEEFWGSLGGGFDGRGFWSEMQRKERLSQLFRVSLIFSLGMANPWMGSASAITSKEWVGELHASAILQPYESNKIGSPLHSYHMGDTRAASGWLSQEDELPGKTFSLNINENRPLKLQSKEMFQVAEASKVCEETYGFLPCSDSVGGNLALIVAYGYLLLIAAQLISKGSELLLEVVICGS
ncbi:hypothetical protein Mapa_015975 [Marchantia paleacea]|nr:hypothetical protein Mapa_015975 [Marchantia paleacea]